MSECQCEWSSWLARVADLWQALAMRLDSFEAEKLDKAIQEAWVSRYTPIENPDRMVSAKEAAFELGITVDMVNGWARTHPDLIKREKRGNKAFFHLGDLVEFRDSRRKKQKP